MLHPSAPAIVFTPICPHSLAFRPIVFADSAKLRLDVDPHARADAWVTFDGRRRVRLRRGAKLYVEASPRDAAPANRGGLVRIVITEARAASEEAPEERR
jgi:NAD kinase